MGMIKTALEIALEKTDEVKSDRSSIKQYEAKQRGKKLANAFLAGELDLAEELKKTSGDENASLKQGIFDVLAAQISLPVRDENEDRMEKLGKGLSAVIKTKEFTAMFKELSRVCAQYLQEASQYEKMIHQQYAPKLRKKEEEISRRMGREVRIDPFQDPEFAAFHNQHMKALKGNYEPVIEQARAEARRMFEN